MKDPVQYAKRSFQFIEKDWGYSALPVVYSDKYTGGALLVYTHFDYKKRIEVAVGKSDFQMIIRRVVDGNPAPYENGDNWVELSALFSLWNQSLSDITKNALRKTKSRVLISEAAEQLEKYKGEFTSSDWTPFDDSKGRFVTLLRNSLGYNVDESGDIPFMKGAHEVIQNDSVNWKLDTSSEHLPPYHVKRYPAFATYRFGNDVLEVRELDIDGDQAEHEIVRNGSVLGTITGESEDSFNALRELLLSK